MDGRMAGWSWRTETWTGSYRASSWRSPVRMRRAGSSTTTRSTRLRPIWRTSSVTTSRSSFASMTSCMMRHDSRRRESLTTTCSSPTAALPTTTSSRGRLFAYSHFSVVFVSGGNSYPSLVQQILQMRITTHQKRWKRSGVRGSVVSHKLIKMIRCQLFIDLDSTLPPLIMLVYKKRNVK